MLRPDLVVHPPKPEAQAHGEYRVAQTPTGLRTYWVNTGRTEQLMVETKTRGNLEV